MATLGSTQADQEHLVVIEMPNRCPWPSNGCPWPECCALLGSKFGAAGAPAHARKCAFLQWISPSATSPLICAAPKALSPQQSGAGCCYLGCRSASGATAMDSVGAVDPTTVLGLSTINTGISNLQVRAGRQRDGMHNIARWGAAGAPAPGAPPARPPGPPVQCACVAGRAGVERAHQQRAHHPQQRVPAQPRRRPAGVADRGPGGQLHQPQGLHQAAGQQCSSRIRHRQGGQAPGGAGAAEAGREPRRPGRGCLAVCSSCGPNNAAVRVQRGTGISPAALPLAAARLAPGAFRRPARPHACKHPPPPLCPASPSLHCRRGATSTMCRPRRTPASSCPKPTSTTQAQRSARCW